MAEPGEIQTLDVAAPDTGAGDAAEARNAAARRTAQSVTKSTPKALQPLPKVTDDAGFEALEMGSEFIDPEGKTRTKPWRVTSDEDFAKVPEGVDFIDPSGQTRTKPKYEPLPFTSQTLYDMAVTDKERRKALAYEFGEDSIKTGPDGQPYVEHEDKRYKPKGFMAGGALAMTAAQAAPVAGAVLGAIGGGVAAAPTGPGAVAGAVAGGASGGALGQTFNDVIMQIAGIYDRTPVEQAAATGMAALSGGAGSGVGRGAAAIVPALGGAAKVAAPAFAGKFLGAKNLDEVTFARQLAEKGERKGKGVLGALGIRGTDVKPQVSSWAHETPHMTNIQEVFYPKFHADEPLASTTKYYEAEARQVLERAGVDTSKIDSVAKPTSAVATDKAGQAVLDRARGTAAMADAKLDAALAQKQLEGEMTWDISAIENTGQRESLRKAAEDSRQAAQKLIDLGFEDIQRNVDNAFKVAKAGKNSGELWQQTGEQLRAMRTAIGQRASRMYDGARALGGGVPVNISRLTTGAREFVEQLPEDFQSKYPDIVRKIRDLGGVVGKDGEWIKEPAQPDFVQLWQVRSQLRSNTDFNRLNSDIKNGVMKHFSHEVDAALRDVERNPALAEAVAALNRADAYYAKNIPIFNAQSLKAVIRGLEAGVPADPKKLYDVLIKDGTSELLDKTRRLVGPNIWGAIKATDIQDMMDAAKTFKPGEIDGKDFAKQVLDRHKSGLLQAVHGSDVSERLLNQARAIEGLEGRLDMPVRPGDTLSDTVQRAKLSADAAKVKAESDPLGTLAEEMKKIEAAHKREVATIRSAGRKEPLGFLLDPTVGANEAANRILNSEDLILAAAARFPGGEKSPEFELLRQVYVQRLLQGTLQPGSKLAKMSPEVQQIMFPGATLEQMQLLAKEMDFLMETRAAQGTGASISAQTKVESPVGGRLISGTLKIIPGVNALGRAARGKYYSMVNDLISSPSTLRWIEKGLKGNAEQREAVRRVVQRAMQKGSAAGAGAGESLNQTPNFELKEDLK